MNRKRFIANSLLGLGALGLTSAVRNSPKYSEHPTQTPPPLKKGDTLAIFAPAGAVFSPQHIKKLETVLLHQGFKVRLAPNLYQQKGYLAGSDQERVATFHALMADQEIKGLIAVRGGFGCARMLPKIDLDLIRQNPKIIMGYSDLTSLLNYITQETGLITYHGPMAYSTWNKFALSEFDAAFKQQKAKRLITLRDAEQYSNKKGKASGKLLGGNLSVITSMLGTSYQPNFKGKILFLEETNEEPYIVDRMLTQLRDAQVFNAVNGIILGKFNNCVAEFPEESLPLKEVFDYHFKELNIPVFGFANFGHVKDKYILDIGRTTEINTENFSFTLL
ncbi:LD-carboxypeptidase [Lishizhenia sp.]|uniref:S66 peptidase family protein n=1 Tax=Lishizhenia sp. TaxID=2497594 RepID=UPI00299D0E8E|nr:LD-carboxypeptidase [Lishizhenia sp.]MDX1446256.1 LD-carboxypeptidase [Lishizhenia sp.]